MTEKDIYKLNLDKETMTNLKTSFGEINANLDVIKAHIITGGVTAGIFAVATTTFALKHNVPFAIGAGTMSALSLGKTLQKTREWYIWKNYKKDLIKQAIKKSEKNNKVLTK